MLANPHFLRKSACGDSSPLIISTCQSQNAQVQLSMLQEDGKGKYFIIPVPTLVDFSYSFWNMESEKLPFFIYT
jgi:hypothetical protein